jgi:hypothetical protein
VATYAFTVNGASQELQPGWRIAESANSRNRMDFSVLLPAGTGRLVNDDAIALAEDGVTIFGGLVDNPAEAGLGGSSATAAIVQSLSAADYNIYPSRVSVGANTDRPSESLKARLTWIAGLMAAQGVTLDAAQAVGPTLPAASYLADRYLVDVLEETTSLASGTGATSWVWNVGYTKALIATEAGTVAAPFNIIEGDDNVTGDITVQQPRPSDYGNYAVVLGGTGTKDVTDAFTGNGATVTFALRYALATSYGYVTVNGVNETLGTGATWSYSIATNSITRTSAPGVGAAISITYIASFPKRVVSDGGASAANRVTRTYTEPDVFDVAIMQALADAYVTRDIQSPKTANYAAAFAKTGLHPGQTQSITKASRGLSGAHLLTAVEIAHVSGSLVQRRVVAVSTTRLPSTLRQKFKQTFGTSIGGSAASSSGVTVVTGGTYLQSPAFLGGSDRTPYVAPNPTAWTRVPSALPYVAPATLAVTLRTMVVARKTGIGVTVRLFDATAGAAAITSGLTTIAAGGVAQEVTAGGTLTSGHKYWLEVQANTNGEGVSAIGHLEAA